MAGDCLNMIVKTGKLNAAKIEAKEIILLAINTANQISIVNPKTIFNPGILIDKPNNTPKVVATPLPPLNFKKMVQLCPNMQLTPIRIQKISWAVVVFWAK